MSLAQDLAAKLQAVSRIDDPFTGRAAPAVVEARSRGWPTAAEWAEVKSVRVTQGEGRRIEEYRYVPADGGPEQPIAVVFDEEDGAPVARLYAQHQWVEDRADVLPVDPSVKYGTGPDDVMTRYFTAIGSSEKQAAMALFLPEGYIQHSNGDKFQGAERLSVDFDKFFAVGPIRLKYANKTDTGDVCAYECYMPSGRPAIAVYERGGADRQFIAAVRLYL